MEQVKHILIEAFTLRHDTASYEEIEERLLSGGKIHGTNLCILMLAIFIASIGLNMNSTAVIIGAMLISPLMGTIMATGYGFATGDLGQVRDSLIGLLFQVIVCLFTSSLYFFLSPISTAHSELLARTTPTIWDVLIATFGGCASIIGITRKEKSNVIPGVAIATALMPPLCTAGYGIATHSAKFFFGAMYLFFINSYFICLTSCIILIILKVPQKTNVPSIVRKHLKKKLVIITTILIIPSVILSFELVRENMAENTVTDTRVDAFQLERITKEAKLLFPEIEDIHIGYMENWDTEENTLKENLLIIISCSQALDETEKNHLEKWLTIETKATDIEFVETGKAAS